MEWFKRNQKSKTATGSAAPYVSSRSAAQERKMPSIPADDQGYSLAAQAVADIFACSMIRAQAVSHIPITVRKIVSEVEVEESAWFNAVRFARKRFHQDLLFRHEWALSIWGKNYELKLVQENGFTPGGLQWLNPQAMTAQAPRGQIEYYDYRGSTSSEKYYPKQIGHNYTPNSDSDIDGDSPIRSALGAANIIRNAAAYVEAFYAHDASVGGILSGRSRSAAFGNAPMPMTEEDRKLIMKMWQAQTQGSRKSFRTILLPFELEYTQFEGKPPTTQVELTSDKRRDIHMVMRVPMSLTYAEGTADPLSAGSTLTREQAIFWENFVIPEHESILDYYNIDIMPWLAPGEELVGDYSKILAAIGDTAERRTMLRADVAGGTMMVNEYRESIGQAKISGGDVFYVPGGAVITPKGAFILIQDATPEIIESTEAPVLALPEPASETEQPQPILDRAPVMTEIKQWRRWMEKRIKAGQTIKRQYKCEHIPPPWVEEIKDDLAKYAPNNDLSKVADVFWTALETYKDLTARVRTFENKFATLLGTARGSNPIPKARFRTVVRSEIQRFGRLMFREGLIDGGVQDGVPDADESKLMNSLITAFTPFVRSFTNEVYGTGLTDAQAATRPQMWSNKLQKLYQEGLSSANGNQMQKFTGVDGNESCQTCQALKGQVHRAKDWRRKELRPGVDGHNYQCGAWQCHHDLENVSSRAIGTFPSNSQVRAWAAKSEEYLAVNKHTCNH